jgi:hypothetical protein
MARTTVPVRGRALALAAPLLVLFSLIASGCGVIGFQQRPAANYWHGSGAPLRVAIIDESGPAWSSALASSLRAYEDGAAPHLIFQPEVAGANIIITVKTYTDTAPPRLQGYDFPQGAGGFATVYDAQGVACNYPPSDLPLTCSGEITTTEIWLNEAIPAGSDIESRRIRLITHELGHAMGLTRHAPTLDINTLAQRYGWEMR